MAAAVSTWVAGLVARVLPTVTRPAAISWLACSRERASFRRTSSASRRRRATPATVGSAPALVVRRCGRPVAERRRGRRGPRGSGACVERGQRVSQPRVYLPVHLQVAVRGHGVGDGQPVELSVDLGVPGGGAGDVQRVGRG